MQASIFGNDIRLLANTLKPLHKYCISNASVQGIDSKFRVVPNEYQWTISGRTPIIELNNTEEASLIAPVFNFVSFSDLFKHINSVEDIGKCIYHLS